MAAVARARALRITPCFCLCRARLEPLSLLLSPLTHLETGDRRCEKRVAIRTKSRRCRLHRCSSFGRSGTDKGANEFLSNQFTIRKNYRSAFNVAPAISKLWHLRARAARFDAEFCPALKQLQPVEMNPPLVDTACPWPNSRSLLLSRRPSRSRLQRYASSSQSMHAEV